MAVEHDGSESLNEATPQSPEGDVSSEQLAQTPEIQAKFAEVFGGAGDSAEGEVETTAQDAADAEQQDELVESELAARRDEGSKTEGDEPDAAKDGAAKADAKQQAKPGNQEAPATLDPVLRHAAKRAGWTDDRIDRLVKLDPEFAVETFNRLHGSFNDLSTKYAELGKARMNAGQPPALPAQQPEMGQPPVKGLDALFNPKALDDFGNEYGKELVEKFLKPLHSEVIQPMRQMAAWYEQQQRETLRVQVNTIFKGWEGDFADLYGKGAELTKDQLDARSKVANLADQITAGAAAQGIELSVADALERAHALFTADRRAEIERKQLASKVVKRAGQITARPTQRKVATTAAEGAPKGDDAAMAAYRQKAAELGLSL